MPLFDAISCQPLKRVFTRIERDRSLLIGQQPRLADSGVRKLYTLTTRVASGDFGQLGQEGKYPVGSPSTLEPPVSRSMRPEPSHSSQPLCGPNLPLVHPKVVRNFMPKRLLHQAFQILAVASHPLVRTLEYRDSIGQVEGLKNAAVRKGLPFIQSEKGAVRRNSSRFKLDHRRLIFDYYGYVIHAASKSRGNVA